jgi:co-chaperonin GroES (HSP10)
LSDFVDQIEPVGGCVVVRDDEVDRELESGLSLPENARVTIETGTILRIGPDVHPAFSSGRRVVFRPNAGVPVCRESDLSGAKVIRILGAHDIKCFLPSEVA